MTVFEPGSFDGGFSSAEAPLPKASAEAPQGLDEDSSPREVERRALLKGFQDGLVKGVGDRTIVPPLPSLKEVGLEYPRERTAPSGSGFTPLTDQPRKPQKGRVSKDLFWGEPPESSPPSASSPETRKNA